MKKYKIRVWWKYVLGIFLLFNRVEIIGIPITYEYGIFRLTFDILQIPAWFITLFIYLFAIRLIIDAIEIEKNAIV